MQVINCFFFASFFVLFSLPLSAHTFSGMIGFYDGLSHPVLGIDHFLAMVSVGIVSAQIGGRAIWTVPITFVCVMFVGGLIGITTEIISNSLNEDIIVLINYELFYYFVDHLYSFIEFGIILSVIFLGLAIAIARQFSVGITMVFVGIFGLCHGVAHGLEMPLAINPILFALGFSFGTASLHLFGVIIGYNAIRSILSSIFLRAMGLICSVYGIYLFIINI